MALAYPVASHSSDSQPVHKRVASPYTFAGRIRKLHRHGPTEIAITPATFLNVKTHETDLTPPTANGPPPTALHEASVATSGLIFWEESTRPSLVPLSQTVSCDPSCETSSFGSRVGFSALGSNLWQGVSYPRLSNSQAYSPVYMNLLDASHSLRTW